MKGNPQLIEKLNSLLAEELTAINQYMVHSEMCENWGYGKLHKKIEERAIAEMKHAESLIERILFLEGIPIVSQLLKIHIGADVKTQLENDLQLEYEANTSYNEGIKLATEVGDNFTRDFLTNLLITETDHIDWIEAQQDQIEQVGIANYLVEQIG